MHSHVLRYLSVIGFIFGFTVSLQAQWSNVTANLSEMASECGNMCLLSVVPGQDKIMAGIAQRGLWQTIDGGGTCGNKVLTNAIWRHDYR
jgi:hypothetical protein